MYIKEETANEIYQRRFLHELDTEKGFGQTKFSM
jgi:hypothetical protein